MGKSHEDAGLVQSYPELSLQPADDELALDAVGAVEDLLDLSDLDALRLVSADASDLAVARENV